MSAWKLMVDKELLYHRQGASSLALQRQIVSLPIGSFFDGLCDKTS